MYWIQINRVYLKNYSYKFIFQISGFGATSVNGGGNSDRLQILFLLTLDDDKCHVVNREVNFCTSNGYGQGFCTSDLGGPLVANDQLIGIANWNHPCGMGETEDVYARISNYRLWIGGIAGV